MPQPAEDHFRSVPGKRLVIASRSGRLANRLAIFANLVGFAEEYGHRVVNCTFHSYAHLFAAPASDIYCRYPLPRRKSVFDFVPGLSAAIRKSRIFYRLSWAACLVNEKLPEFTGRFVTLRERPGPDVTPLEGPEVSAKIAQAKTVFVTGWNFRAPRCVESHASKIRDYFRPVPALERSSREKVQALRHHAGLVIGVHIRHGDYRGWRNGKYFFPAERYAHWMKAISAQRPSQKVAFLVCSDEPRSAEEFPGLDVSFAAASPVEDLYALAECDYIMGPVSSFSQWASFTGNKPLFHLANSQAVPRLEDFRPSYLGAIPH